ncbi:transposase [Kitasatospora sp. NPDC056184]|uniref:transposase n=1 Tax=Kitasatospora sp. NPDC056184 TaxID=3345738 RepID=UPI0035D7D744
MVFAPLARCDQRAKGALYLQGLSLESQRTCVSRWPSGSGSIISGSLMTFSPWPVEDVWAHLAQRTVLALQPNAWAMNGAGFPEDDKARPGPPRRCSGTLGKVGTCQIGTSGHASCSLSWPAHAEGAEPHQPPYGA